jgi:hypothetical protein
MAASERKKEKEGRKKEEGKEGAGAVDLLRRLRG